MTSLCCKRACGFFVFLIFGLICVGISYKVAEDNDEKSISTYTYILYGILLFTSIRYKQYITECQRCCSGFLVLSGYALYWVLLANFYMDLHDQNIIYMAICSGITALSDITIFTSYCYKDDKAAYEIIPVYV
jgi:hypothetical protein